MNQPSQTTINRKIALGISACVMGEQVRFNGGHKRSRFCTDELSKYFDFKPVCPEVAIGMGVPRQPIRLLGKSAQDNAPRAVGVDTPELDVTEPLLAYADECTKSMPELCGYIFMQKSPSCGLFDVKRYLPNGHPEGKVKGLFAGRILENNPLLPVEEAGRLNDAALRENFMVRVFTYHDWHDFLTQPLTPKRLINFHSRYKYLIMAHSTSFYKQMGQLLADLSTDIEEKAHAYFQLLMTSLAKPATRKTHTNTLMHLQGYLKKVLSPADKQELADIILRYHEGVIPLIVPLTLLKHHLNHQEGLSDYARQQVYLNPYPYELGLRNAI